MRIFIGADHHGFELKNKLVEYLEGAGYDVVDKGGLELDPTDDFTDYAAATARAVLSEDQDTTRAILLCGSGQGVCMAANRFKGVRAALGYDNESVRSSRNDDDANVLCLPANSVSLITAKSLVDTFLKTPFAAASRFKRRIREMDELS